MDIDPRPFPTPLSTHLASQLLDRLRQDGLDCNEVADLAVPRLHLLAEAAELTLESRLVGLEPLDLLQEGGVGRLAREGGLAGELGAATTARAACLGFTGASGRLLELPQGEARSVSASRPTSHSNSSEHPHLSRQSIDLALECLVLLFQGRDLYLQLLGEVRAALMRGLELLDLALQLSDA